MSIVSLLSTLYQVNETLVSNPLSVLMTEFQCSTDPCDISVVLQKTIITTNSDTAVREWIDVTCLSEDYSWHDYVCMSGYFLNITCNGTAGVIHQSCPTVEEVSVCNSLSSDDNVIRANGCTVQSYSESNVTCLCSLYSDVVVDADTGYSVNYVAMLESTFTSYAATYRSLDTLSNRTAARGKLVLVTLGVFLFVIALSLLWSYEADLEDSKIVPNGEKSTWWRCWPTKGSSKISASTESKRFLREDSNVKMVEDSLPAILSSESTFDRWKREIKRYHRWFGVIFFYSSNFSRVLRVLSLYTNIIILLFVQSLTYNVTNPDDGSCPLNHTRSTCLAAPSPYSSHDTKCFWSGSSTSHGVCKFNEPDQSWKIVVYVAVFSALVSTPFALLVDFLIRNVIAAPLARNGVGSVSGKVIERHFTSVSLTEPNAGPFVTKAGLKESVQEFGQMAIEMRDYRDTLAADQKDEFDYLWGLDKSGAFLCTESADRTTIITKWLYNRAGYLDVNQAVLADLQEVHANSKLEVNKLSDDLADSERDICKRLLYLFQVDLLPGVSGLIVEVKTRRDTASAGKVSWKAKVCAWAAVVCINVGMLFYILLFALRQDIHRQSAWFKSFIIWLGVEIFVVSTAAVFVTHILLPSLVMKDVHKIKRKLLDALQEFKRTKNNHDDSQSPLYANKPFNAAKYLFVSHRVAKEFPNLTESKVILQFSTPWPKKTYQHSKNVSKDYSKRWSAVPRSLSMILVFFLTSVVSLPFTAQDILLQSFSTAGTGYLVLLLIELFNIFPLLAFVPLFVVIVSIYVIIRVESGRAEKRLESLKAAERDFIEERHRLISSNNNDDDDLDVELGNGSGVALSSVDHGTDSVVAQPLQSVDHNVSGRISDLQIPEVEPSDKLTDSAAVQTSISDDCNIAEQRLEGVQSVKTSSANMGICSDEIISSTGRGNASSTKISVAEDLDIFASTNETVNFIATAQKSDLIIDTDLNAELNTGAKLTEESSLKTEYFLSIPQENLSTFSLPSSMKR